MKSQPLIIKKSTTVLFNYITVSAYGWADFASLNSSLFGNQDIEIIAEIKAAPFS